MLSSAHKLQHCRREAWAAADDGEGWGVDTTVHCRLRVLMMTMTKISDKLLTFRAQVKIATFTSPKMENEILEIFIHAN